MTKDQRGCRDVGGETMRGQGGDQTRGRPEEREDRGGETMTPAP